MILAVTARRRKNIFKHQSSLQEDRAGSASYRGKQNYLTSSLKNVGMCTPPTWGLRLPCEEIQPLWQLHYQKLFLTSDKAQKSENLFFLQQVISLPLCVNHLGFILCLYCESIFSIYSSNCCYWSCNQLTSSEGVNRDERKFSWQKTMPETRHFCGITLQKRITAKQH